MSAIQADYRTNKHIPSRKCYQLILEVSEEDFPNVCNVLGYPKTGENTYVGIALLSNEIYNKPPVVGNPDIQQTEGERLRIRAVLLCKDIDFQRFASTFIDSKLGYPSESECAWYIKALCNIKSRSELATNLEAQAKFRMLDQRFKDWQYENHYQDNIGRM